MNDERTPLTAALTLAAKARSPEEVVARVELRNASAAPLQIDLWPVRSPSLTIEIRGSSDQPVRLPPPPVPGGGQELHELPPNGTTLLEYRNFLPPWIEPGLYRVRFRYVHSAASRVESAWQKLEIGS